MAARLNSLSFTTIYYIVFLLLFCFDPRWLNTTPSVSTRKPIAGDTVPQRKAQNSLPVLLIFSFGFTRSMDWLWRCELNRFLTSERKEARAIHWLLDDKLWQWKRDNIRSWFLSVASATDQSELQLKDRLFHGDVSYPLSIVFVMKHTHQYSCVISKKPQKVKSSPINSIARAIKQYIRVRNERGGTATTSTKTSTSTTNDNIKQVCASQYIHSIRLTVLVCALRVCVLLLLLLMYAAKYACEWRVNNKQVLTYTHVRDTHTHSHSGE